MNPKLNPKPRGRHAGLCTLVGVFAFLGMCAFIIFQMRSIGLEDRRAEAVKKAAAGPQASLTLTFGFSDGAQYLCEQDGGAAFTADFSDPLACGGILSDEDLVSITYSYPESSEPDTLYYRAPAIYRYDGTPSELSPDGSDWLVVTGVDTSATADFGYSVSISYTLPGGDLPRAFALVTPDETISADAVTNTGGYNAPYSSGTARFTVYAESDAALDALLAASTLTAERWQPIDACGAAVTCSLADVRLVAAPEEERGGTIEGAAAKPVIYLYPEEPTDVTATLDYAGEFTCTYPAYSDGWTVRAEPDGTLHTADGREYSYLFWEGVDDTDYDLSRGYCVAGADTEAFLQRTLEQIGLTPREYNEFIVYWLPRMQDNAYNLITFQTTDYENAAKLTIEPQPDSVLRVFMVWQPLDAPVEVEEPAAPAGFDREGFTVVEWGGREVG